MFALRSAVAIRTECSIQNAQKAACTQTGWRRNAHSQRDRKTNQQERAIRVKSQEKARSKRSSLDDGLSTEEPNSFNSRVEGSSTLRRAASQKGSSSKAAFDAERKRPILPWMKRNISKSSGRTGQSSSQPMMSSTSLRDKRYKASQQLMGLLHADMTASDACDLAIEKVEAMKPFVRRSSYVYNSLLRHLLRANRGSQAMKTMQEMKKNGVSPTIETFRALYMGVVRLQLQAKRDTNLIDKYFATFDQFVEFWNDAIRHDQGMKEVERFDEEQKSTPIEEMKKGKLIKYTNTTAESYRTTEIEAWEGAIAGYTKFCRAMDQYLEFMLYLGFDEKAARLCLDSAELAKPAWSKSGKNYAPGLVQTLARRILAHDHKPSEKVQDEELWKEAVEFARFAIKDEEGNRALKSLDRYEEEMRWKTMQKSNQFSLALSDEDRRQLFDEEVSDDRPPKFDSRL